MSVYPNPANDELNVKFEHKTPDIILELTDLHGRIIDRYIEPGINGQHTMTINLQQLPIGIYILKVNSSNESRIFKISKS